MRFLFGFHDDVGSRINAFRQLTQVIRRGCLALCCLPVHIVIHWRIVDLLLILLFGLEVLMGIWIALALNSVFVFLMIFSLLDGELVEELLLILELSVLVNPHGSVRGGCCD